jgi:hypothetical protein
MMLKIVALSVVAAIAASAAQAQTAEQKMVEQIDRTFVCPEALPSDEARHDSLKLFLEQVAAAKPNITVMEITQFRVAMLRKHDCNETLAHLGVSPVVKPTAAPGYDNTDHWERAANIPGARGMVVTVDMDSMISAGGQNADVDQVPLQRRWPEKYQRISCLRTTGLRSQLSLDHIAL